MVVLLTWSGPVHLMVTLLWLPPVGFAQRISFNSDPLSLSHRRVGELTNTGVGKMGLNRGRSVQFHRPLVGPQKGRLPLLVPLGLGPAPRGLATAP